MRPIRPAPLMDRDSAPWWQALARHEFQLQRCSDCAAWRWPPRAMCGRCSSFEWIWTAAGGRATVASYVVNHHPFLAGVATPYAVVTAQLAEQGDLLLPGAYAGGIATLRIGLPLVAVFEDSVATDGTEFTVLAWQAEQREATG